MRYFKIFLLLSCVAFFVSCSSSISPKEIQLLNGYWEIARVQLPDGTTKDFTINGSIDFFEVNQSVGKRFKVMPQFNGEYLTNEVAEDFVIDYRKDSTWIIYTTDYSSWEEQLMKLNDKELVVKNQNDIIYTYKRPVPFTLK
ncbi:hypothetical protein ACYSNX_12765 [Myroides sp. LJL115]